jgi:putative DNA methylase
MQTVRDACQLQPNTLFTYGCRASQYSLSSIKGSYKSYPLEDVKVCVANVPTDQLTAQVDIFITDPPYGDAIKYEEILDFFIAWLRKNPPPEFANWLWDSRRSLAIKGEDEDFRRSMVAAYKRMTECMPDNGIQVVMFTHQNGSIWCVEPRDGQKQLPPWRTAGRNREGEGCGTTSPSRLDPMQY